MSSKPFRGIQPAGTSPSARQIRVSKPPCTCPGCSAADLPNCGREESLQQARFPAPPRQHSSRGCGLFPVCFLVTTVALGARRHPQLAPQPPWLSSPSASSCHACGQHVDFVIQPWKSFNSSPSPFR